MIFSDTKLELAPVALTASSSSRAPLCTPYIKAYVQPAARTFAVVRYTTARTCIELVLRVCCSYLYCHYQSLAVYRVHNRLHSGREGLQVLELQQNLG